MSVIFLLEKFRFAYLPFHTPIYIYIYIKKKNFSTHNLFIYIYKTLISHVGTKKETFVVYFFWSHDLQLIKLTMKQRADLVVYLGVVLPHIHGLRQILNTNNINNNNNTIFFYLVIISIIVLLPLPLRS
jgi:hypothetical protein